MTWCLEAWVPRDGVAFASERGPRDDGLAWTRALKRTVCIRAPHWDAVDVRSATAVRAFQLPFQPGFFTAQGDEIVFPNLGSLIEMVRRAYVAGGGDSDSGPEPIDGEPHQPDGDDWADDGLLEWYDSAERAAGTARPVQPAPGSFRFARPGLSEKLARGFFHTYGGQRILNDVAEQVVLDILAIFAKRITHSPTNERFRASFFSWVQLMFRAGLLRPGLLFPILAPIDDELARDIEHSIYHPYGLPYVWQWTSSPQQKASPVLFHVPMPALSVRRAPRERLIDSLMLALSTPTARHTLGSKQRWAVWLVAASTLVAQQPGTWSTWTDSARRKGAVLETALTWLLCELPVPISLARDAEFALAEYAAKVTLT